MIQKSNSCNHTFWTAISTCLKISDDQYTWLCFVFFMTLSLIVNNHQQSWGIGYLSQLILPTQTIQALTLLTRPVSISVFLPHVCVAHIHTLQSIYKPAKYCCRSRHFKQKYVIELFIHPKESLQPISESTELQD